MRVHRRSERIATLIVSMLLVVSCSDPTEDILRSQPIASVVPAGTRIVSDRYEKSGETLGKPQSAALVRRFVPLDGVTSTAALDSAVDAAVGEGWELDPRTEGVSYRGEQNTPEGVVELDVYYSMELDSVIIALALQE